MTSHGQTNILTNNTRIVLFDGVCNLCNGFVNFLIKRDRAKKLKFVPLQSDTGHLLMNKFAISNIEEMPNTLIFIKDFRCYDRSSASLRILSELGGIYKVLKALLIIPKPIRDLVYRLIARYRYKLFGKKESCMVPTPEIKERFLD